MSRVLDVEIVEVEIGPHFVTFYGGNRKDLFELAKTFKPMFQERYPELADIQQKDFAHELHDPRVYHPYGHPSTRKKPRTVLKKENDHFHIRFGYEPSIGEARELLKIMQNMFQIKLADHLKYCFLEDDMALEWKYPKIPKSRKAYLKLIEDIRANKYNSVVE